MARSGAHILEKPRGGELCTHCSLASEALALGNSHAQRAQRQLFLDQLCVTLALSDCVRSYARSVVNDDAPPPRRGPYGLVRHNSRMARLAAAVLVSSTGDPFSQAVSLVLLYRATRAPVAIAAAYGAEM